jgi:putative transposase
VTQRGNRRQPTFLRPFDYELYRQLLVEQCRKAEVEIWAYCQLPNHVHMILVPSDPAGLARGIGEAHRRYTASINRREGWIGHLWQGRFASFPMGEPHLYRAVRYVLQNPVRAGLVSSAFAWPHSSLAAHVARASDGVVEIRGLDSRIEDWTKLLDDPCSFPDRSRFRRHERSGAPLLDSFEPLDVALGVAAPRAGISGPR